MAEATADGIAELEHVFPGASEMARLMRGFDWSATDFGAPQRWPPNLRIAVSLCLASRFPILLWWGPRLSLLYNDAYIPFLGPAKHPRMLGRPGKECWGEIWHSIGPMLERVVRTGVATWSEDFEFYFARRLPLEEVYVTFTYAPILASDGSRVEGIFCPCFETTERVVGARRLETLRKLGMRSTQARSVQTACEDAAAVLRENPRDISFAAIYVGGQGEARYAAGVLPGHGHSLPAYVADALDDAHSSWPLAQVLRAKQASELADLEARGVHIAGGEWPELTRQALVLPIQAAQERIAGLLVVGAGARRPLDAGCRTFFELVAGHIGNAISDADAYEAERRRAEALAELDRAKTAFFSNVSHEFRTPLTLMLGPLEEELHENPSERLKLAHRNALRLLKLVNALLDFSRIEAGHLQARYAPVDLPAHTAELAAVFRAAIEKAGLRLVVDCPPMPEAVQVDLGMWEKIVLNLLSNAFKFTFEGEIRVSLVKAGDQAELCVSDTGTGIPQHELPRVFERFHRIAGARGRTFEGSGIGLALVAELAQLHGGAVRAESEEGRGSRFTVTVPLRSADLPAGHGVTASTPSSSATQASAYVEEALRWLPDGGLEETAAPGPHAPQARILFADDNADMRQYVRRLLGVRYEVELAADGEAALAAATRNPPALVLADVMMPGLDGFGLLQALRAAPGTRDVPVILLSARAGEESRLEGIRGGADDYLVKPFSARELLARVDARLEIARLRRAALEREQALRESAEGSERRMRDELLAELAAMSRLHELSTRLLRPGELQPLLQEVLDASIELLNADFGNIQLYDPDTGALKIAAQRGFKQEFLDHFDRVHEGSASCGTALERRSRVVVEDVLTEPSFAAHRPVVAAAGYRAVQSTPLIGRDGEVLGMLSTHFRRPHRPLGRELRLLDLYARQAAELIERRHAEEKLRSSEERFRNYFNLGLIGGALTSPDKGILEVNDELCRILGYGCDEMLKKNWAEITHPDDLAADVAQFERVLAGEIEGYALDKRFLRKDGAVIDAIMAARAVRRADGRVDYVVGLVQDITARKRAEQSLQRLQAELAHVTRVSTMGEMASSIAHEVNQPLAAIVANASACARWLGMEPANLQEASAAAARIARNANHAGEILARIRAFVQRRQVDCSALDLAEVAREALGMAETEIRRHGVSLSSSAHAQLPAIAGDRVHLQQVILNLLKNAVEAMASVAERDRILAVTVNAYGADKVGVAVCDCGIGLQVEMRERIFDAFYTTKAGGMGMGLAISRSIIEAHGGRLWASANEGPGAILQFALPAGAAGFRQA
jgi:PAS domain S-box-containing protein